MVVKRKKDWQESLNSVVESHRNVPFEYGTLDCCLFAAKCLDSVYEDAHFEREVIERINYHSEDDANSAIASAGGLENLVCEFLGTPINPLLAQPGDVVLFYQDNGTQAVGVIVGHMIVASGKDGIRFDKVSKALSAWRVA